MHKLQFKYLCISNNQLFLTPPGVKRDPPHRITDKGSGSRPSLRYDHENNARAL